jgi:hypothetical protein
VIIVSESSGNTAGLATETNFFGDVNKLAFALNVEKANAGGFADGKISFAIVVEIASRAAVALSYIGETRFIGDVLKHSVTEIVEQAALPFRRRDEKKIGLAVAIEIDEAGTAAGGERRGGAGNALR